MHHAETGVGGPLHAYRQLYDGVPRAWSMPQTSDVSVWQHWQQAFQVHLRRRLGLGTAERTLPATGHAPRTQHAGYTRQYIDLDGGTGSTMPAWLLIPDGSELPRAAVVALHGHGYGADDLVGIGRDGAERHGAAGYQQDFAVALCRRGFVVLAPELLGFGRRREPSDVAAGPDQSSCHRAALWGIMLGTPLLGRRVADVLHVLDVLEQRPEVDPKRIGIMGISGGGMVALFVAALDHRIRAAVISGYLSTFRDSILALDHCLCNYVPGLLQDAEMYDIAALLAPRPLLVEAGIDDDIFPLAAVKEAYERVRDAYTAYGIVDHLDRDLFAGGHRVNGAKAYDFLRQVLADGRAAADG